MNPKKPILVALLVGIGFLFGALALQAGAFNPPAQSPPAGNTDPPLTTGEAWQIKRGRVIGGENFRGSIELDSNGEVSQSGNLTYDRSDPDYARVWSLNLNYALAELPLVFGLPGSDCTVRVGGTSTSYENSGVYSVLVPVNSGVLSFSCEDPEAVASKTTVLRSKGHQITQSGTTYSGSNPIPTFESAIASANPGDLNENWDFYVPGDQGSVLLGICTVSGLRSYHRDDGAYDSDRYLRQEYQVPKIRSVSIDGSLVYEDIEDFSSANTSQCPLDSGFFSSYPQTPCITVEVDSLTEGTHSLEAATEWVKGSRDYRSGIVTSCSSPAVYETVTPGPGIWYAAYTYKRTK